MTMAERSRWQTIRIIRKITLITNFWLNIYYYYTTCGLHARSPHARNPHARKIAIPKNLDYIYFKFSVVFQSLWGYNTTYMMAYDRVNEHTKSVLVQSNLNSSNTDVSFTMADSKLFSSPYELLLIATENKYLWKFSQFYHDIVCCVYSLESPHRGDSDDEAILMGTLNIPLFYRWSKSQNYRNLLPDLAPWLFKNMLQKSRYIW